MEHIQFLLLGSGNGAVFAALALALVVTYRSSGVINFATGAIALYVAYTFAYLREGELLIPIPGLPETVELGGKLTLVSALAISMVVAALLGLVLYVLVFRPLRHAPPVAKAVASLGVLVLFQALMAQRVGTSPISVDNIFPDEVVQIGEANVRQNRLWFAGVIVLIGLLLAAAFRFTRFGLATRAVAETEKGAVVSGLSPDRIAALNWMISAMVAGLAGILIAPIVPLVPVSYTLFIVPALAAALVGQFQALAPTVVAGVLIGAVQSELVYLQGRWDWLPSSGAPELVPLAVVLVVLVVRGRPLPSRGAIIQRTLGRAPRPRGLALPALVGTVVAAAALVALDGEWRGALLTTIILAVVSLSLVVVTGYAGQVSLAQLTLAGAAGFVLAGLTTNLSVPFPIAPILAALAATVIGVAFGIPAIRVRGLSVAVVTLALAVSLESIWFRNNDVNGGTGGARIVTPSLFGLDLGVGRGAEFPRLAFCFLCLGVLVGVGIGVAKLRTSALGSAMLAVRANERAAAAAGVDVVRVKLTAFAIGSFIAGLGGALLAYKQGSVTYASYTAIAGLGLFATAYLAGITSVSGGILAGALGAGGIVFLGIENGLESHLDIGLYYEVATGILLVLTVILNPEGIVGPAHRAVERLRLRRAGPIPEPETVDVGSPVAGTSAVAGPPTGSGPALVASNVAVRFGGVVAVDDVSFEVGRGHIFGVIGPNGAGKTTLLDAISGFNDGGGSLEVDGDRFDRLAPHERVRRGLGRTFQAIELYDDLSVAENVMVGLSAGRRRGVDATHMDEVFAVLGLHDVRDRPAGELSQGQRQLVSVARAMVGAPTVLLLDEPAGGLDSNESRWLGDRLCALRDSGTTIVLVDHDMGLVLGVCDEICVLDFGRVIAQGPPEVVRSEPRVVEAYLGSAHSKQAAPA